MAGTTKEADTKKMAKIMKALAHPNRLELFLEIMRQSEVGYSSSCVCLVSHICGALNIGAPTISHHLKELANADLITTDRQGKYLVARINRETLALVSGLLSLNGVK